MIVPAPSERLPAERLGRVHFVGIGGAALSGIARILLDRGMAVTGSDAADSDVLSDLRAHGAMCMVGHAAEQVDGADTVVVSTAVRADNPEVVEARRRGLRLLSRAAALDALMFGRPVVAVAGTHGKTTTTAMLTVALQSCGADPSYAIGAELAATGANAHDGTDALFVAEADESDGAFLTYAVHGAVVTNVEADHLDNYGTAQAYRAAFDRFVEGIPADGWLVVCADDPGANALVPKAAARGLEVLSTGTTESSQLRATSLRSTAAGSETEVVCRGEVLGRLELRIPGRHYALDALCAIGAGLRLGFPFSCLAAGLGRFSGTRRRMERKGEADGVRVYDSYAHHPTEIHGDLEAARTLTGGGRLIVCFQPHLVSRTKIFAAPMGEALAAADCVLVMDVYAAREEPDSTVSGALVAEHVPGGGKEVVFEPEWGRVPTRLAQWAQPGDLVLTLGAGDVTRIGPDVLRLLERRHDPQGEERR